MGGEETEQDAPHSSGWAPGMRSDPRKDPLRLENLEIDSPKAGPRVFEVLISHFDHRHRPRG